MDWDLCRLPRRAERQGSDLLVVFDEVVIRIGGPPGYGVAHSDAARLAWNPATKRDERIVGTLLRIMRCNVALMRRMRACEKPDGQMIWPSILFPGLKHGARGDLASLRYFWAASETTWQLVGEFAPAAWLSLLRLLSRCPEVAQLARHNPGLAALLAAEVPRWSPDEIRSMIRNKQVALGAVLDCAPDIVRLLARLNRKLCTEGSLGSSPG